MKILRIMGSANPRGGGPIEGLLRSSAAMAKLGHTNEIACLDRAADPWVDQLPLKTHAMGSLTRRYGYSPQFVPWLRERSGDYDAFILHGVWNYSSVGAWQALSKGPKPYFVFTHGMMDPWFLKAQPLKGMAKLAYWNLIERRVLRDAAAVLFTSDEERLLARTAFGGRYAERVVAYGTTDAPSRTDEGDRAFRSLNPALGSRPYLLFLGRLHPKKGCDLLIESFARIAAQFPEVDLVMAGPDQEGWEKALKAQANRLDLSGRVHWPGMLSGMLKWSAFHGAEGFVLPSHSENFGIVVAEAMACRKPVLITNKVNIWRFIEDSGSGLVCDDEPAAFTRSLETFLKLSPSAREQMGRRGRDEFLRRFEIEAAAHNLTETIRSFQPALQS